MISNIWRNLSVTMNILIAVLIVLPMVLSLFLSFKSVGQVGAAPWKARFIRSVGVSYNIITGGQVDLTGTYNRVVTALLRVVGMVFLGYIVWLIVYSIPGQ